MSRDFYAHYLNNHLIPGTLFKSTRDFLLVEKNGTSMIVTFSSQLALRYPLSLKANLNFYLISIYGLIYAQIKLPIYNPSRS